MVRGRGSCVLPPPGNTFHLFLSYYPAIVTDRSCLESLVAIELRFTPSLKQTNTIFLWFAWICAHGQIHIPSYSRLIPTYMDKETRMQQTEWTLQHPDGCSCPSNGTFDCGYNNAVVRNMQEVTNWVDDTNLHSARFIGLSLNGARQVVWCVTCRWLVRWEFLRWLITTRDALRLLIGLVYVQWSDSLGYLLTMNV